jgi:hypothetical protein
LGKGGKFIDRLSKDQLLNEDSAQRTYLVKFNLPFKIPEIKFLMEEWVLSKSQHNLVLFVYLS